ncbi:MAG TPA: hypothetical protein VLF20_02330 [Patescibacteria group bacterium]|nr:hypothetical protein [Patescibacteria group bacterium]
MRREKLTEIRWLLGGGVYLEAFAALNTLSPTPDRGRIIAAGGLGLALLAWSALEYRFEKKRTKKQPHRRTHLP